MQSTQPQPKQPINIGTGFLSTKEDGVILSLVRRHGWCILALVGLALVLFGKGLFSPDLVLSDAGKDGDTYFYNKLLFDREWSSWNPYIHCGSPVVGVFQYMWFYLPRLLLSFLPLPLTINWLIFLHVCLAGVGMYAWASFRGLHRAGALLAGIVFMWCGPMISALPVGDYSLILARAWMPLIFLGVDGWLKHRRLRYLLLASFVATGQIYMGYPQYFYYTALMAGLWSVFGICTTEKKAQAAAGLIMIYPLAALLSSAELVPGFMLVSESVRNHGLSFHDASAGPLPWQNLPMLFAPKICGGYGVPAYWGEWLPYDTTPYVGAATLLLAAIGLGGLSRAGKAKWIFLAALPFVVALGINTPLYTLLYKALPMFSNFRMVSRMLVFFALFVSLLAGMGLGRLIEARKNGRIPIRGVCMAALIIGVVLLASGLALYGGMLDGAFKNFVQHAIPKSVYWPAQNRDLPEWWAMIQGYAARQLVISGLIWLASGALVFWAWRGARLAAAALTVALVADIVFFFAMPLIRYFPSARMDYQPIAEFLAQHPGDDRNLNMIHKDSNIGFKREGLWGFETLLLQRHAYMIMTTQGTDLEQIDVRKNSHLFQLLRLRYAFIPTSQGAIIQEWQYNPLPRFLVVGNYRIMNNPDEMLRTMEMLLYDFRGEVILETDPGLPQPPPGAKAPNYKVNVISSSATRWVISVETSAPGILLMTDTYARGWHATALPGSAQQHYELMPADYSVRGIPLTVAGTHVMEIKYTPPGFAAGIYITLTTVLALILFAIFRIRRACTKCRAEKRSPFPASASIAADIEPAVRDKTT